VPTQDALQAAPTQKPQVPAEVTTKENEKTQASSQPISPATGQQKTEERKFPPAMPTVTLDLKFKPMLDITQVNHYIKFIPPVFDNNNLFFDWGDTLYELNHNDRRFLA
jgi:histone deacetylase complex regulatory component SIN3